MLQVHQISTRKGSVSQAMGINTVGRVVGSSLLATGETHGFIYQSGSLVDLNSLLLPGSGWSVVEANAINDVGQIAGLGINGAGERHALLLTPTPEPRTVSFLIFALLFKRRP
jgi:probable HAF family extracellular repeat protein